MIITTVRSPSVADSCKKGKSLLGLATIFPVCFRKCRVFLQSAHLMSLLEYFLTKNQCLDL